MNEVYISGKVDSVSVLHNIAKGKAHLMLHIRVSHQNQKKEIKNELYAVNAWNNLAVWAEQAIKPGMFVMVRGYLIQHSVDNVARVEVAARHFMINQPISSVKETQNLPES